MALRGMILGYAGLILVLIGSAWGALSLGGHGLAIYVNETSRDVHEPGAIFTQSERLESALLSWSFASLCALIAIVASIALVKSIADDIARRGRGAVDPEEARALLDQAGQNPSRAGLWE